MWKLTVVVMNMYEEGQLKQQTLSQKNHLVTPVFNTARGIIFESKRGSDFYIAEALSASTEPTVGAKAAGTAPIIRGITWPFVLGRTLTSIPGRGRPLKFLVW